MAQDTVSNIMNRGLKSKYQDNSPDEFATIKSYQGKAQQKTYTLSE